MVVEPAIERPVRKVDRMHSSDKQMGKPHLHGKSPKQTSQVLSFWGFSRHYVVEPDTANISTDSSLDSFMVIRGKMNQKHTESAA